MRRIVNVHAFMLDPATKLVRALHARIAASCTRSSASVRFPHKLRAKARSCGSSATNSSWNEGGEGCATLSPAAIFVVELLEKTVKTRRERFVEHRIVNLAETLHPTRLPFPTIRGGRGAVRLAPAISRSIRLRQHRLPSAPVYSNCVGRPTGGVSDDRNCTVRDRSRNN